VKIALYQCESMPGAVPENLHRLATAVADASGAGADLLVTPEMFLSGYNIGGPSARMFAEPADGPLSQSVGELARSHRMAVCYGYPELGPGGEVYNSVALVGPDGAAVTGYRKTHLFGELDRSMFSASDVPPPIAELAGWRVGLLICYDVEFPENCRRLAVAGADLVVVPTANMVPYDIVSRTIVPARAYENQCYVAYANYCGREDGIEYCGESVVAAPDGQLVAHAGRGPELVLAEIELGRLRAARTDNDYLAARRPELYG
jgi:predicted amidohydrolase